MLVDLMIIEFLDLVVYFFRFLCLFMEFRFFCNGIYKLYENFSMMFLKWWVYRKFWCIF